MSRSYPALTKACTIWISHHFVLYKVQPHPCRALTRPAPLSPVSRPQRVRAFVADCTASKYTRSLVPRPVRG